MGLTSVPSLPRCDLSGVLVSCLAVKQSACSQGPTSHFVLLDLMASLHVMTVAVVEVTTERVVLAWFHIRVELMMWAI